MALLAKSKEHIDGMRDTQPCNQSSARSWGPSSASSHLLGGYVDERPHARLTAANS